MTDVGVTVLTPALFIQCLVDVYNAGFAYATANLIRSALALSCRMWLVEQPFITDHPSVKAALLGYRRMAAYRCTRRSPIRHGRLLHLIHAVQRWVPQALRGQVTLAYRLGYAALLRISELLGIRCRHLKFVGRGVQILIPFSKTDQLGHGIHVLVRCPVICQQLAQMVTGLPPDAFIFRISSTLLNNVIRLTARDSRWTGYFSFHSLRHGKASDLWDATHSLPLVMAAGRWSSVAAARLYIHVTDTR